LAHRSRAARGRYTPRAVHKKGKLFYCAFKEAGQTTSILDNTQVSWMNRARRKRSKPRLLPRQKKVPPIMLNDPHGWYLVVRCDLFADHRARLLHALFGNGPRQRLSVVPRRRRRGSAGLLSPAPSLPLPPVKICGGAGNRRRPQHRAALQPGG